MQRFLRHPDDLLKSRIAVDASLDRHIRYAVMPVITARNEAMGDVMSVPTDDVQEFDDMECRTYHHTLRRGTREGGEFYPANRAGKTGRECGPNFLLA